MGNTSNFDTISVGTEEPLNEVMRKKWRRWYNDRNNLGCNTTNKSVLSRYNTVLLNKRTRKNKYGANYADDTDTEYSLNTSITTFDSNIKENKQTTSSANDQILQGKVCENNLKSAKEIPIKDIEFEFEGINFGASREDQQFITQGED